MRTKGSKNKKMAQSRITIFKSLTIAGTPEEIEKIKELSKQSGKSISRFLIDLALN